MESWRVIFSSRKKLFYVRVMVDHRLALLRMYVKYFSGVLG